MEHILYITGACLLGVLGILGIMSFIAVWAYECFEEDTTLVTLDRIEMFVVYEIATLPAAYLLSPSGYGWTVGTIAGLVALVSYLFVGLYVGLGGRWIELSEPTTPTREHVMNGLFWPGFVLDNVTHTPSR